MSSPAIPKDSLVLVTGVNGYIASHIADQFLSSGYRVRGTARSASKAQPLADVFNQKYGPDRFSVQVVEDMSHDGAFDESVKGVAGIAHVASTLTFDSDPNKVIPEVLAGIRGILKSAAAEPSVKRFVYTSSSTAACAPIPNKEFTITSSTWNETQIAEAWAPPPYEDSRKWAVYGASKAEGEKALWEFVKAEKPSFVANAVLPNANFGKVLYKGQGGSTSGWVTALHNGNAGPLASVPPQWFVDVQDTARLHVAAIINPSISNERIFAYAAPYTFNQILGILQKLRPGKTFPEAIESQDRDLSKVPENVRAEELLREGWGKGWTSLEESVKSTVEDLDGSEKGREW